MGVPAGWDIPDEIKTRLSAQSGRQRAMAADGHVVVVLHRVPRPRDPRRDGVLFWHNPGGQWECNQGKPGFAKLKQLVEDYNTAIVALERAYDRAHDTDGWFHVLEAVGPLCRAARNLYDTLQEARTSIDDIQQRNELQGPCDMASDVARAAELLQIDARNALDFQIAKQSEIQSRLSRDRTQASHRLNIMASVFRPLAAIASVFGMNLKNGLEASPVWVFWAVLAVGVMLGITISGLLLTVPVSDQDANLRRLRASREGPMNRESDRG